LSLSAHVKQKKMRGRDGSYPDYNQPTPSIDNIMDSSIDGKLKVDDDKDSKMWTTFCKVGSGYRFQELEALRQRLKFVPARPRSIPSYLVPDTKLDPDDRPDVWVRDPENSIVLELRCYEITDCRWDKFRAKFTLRFPRCISIRYEKPPKEAMTWSQVYKFVVDTRGNRARGFSRALNSHLDGEVKAEGKQRKRKRQITVEVDNLHKATDVSDVKVESELFKDCEFCLLSVNPGTDKAHIEKEIKRNGGSFTQNTLESTDYVLAGPKTLRVRLQIERATHDVIHHSWLLESLEAKKLVPLELRHVIFATPKTQKQLDLRMDEWGDHYTKECTVDSLRETFILIPSEKRQRIEDPSKLRDQMDDREVRCTQLSSSIFNRCVVYVDMYYTVGNPKSLIRHSLLVVIASKIRLYGGIVSNILTSEVTHVVVDDSSYEDIDRKNIYGDLSYKVRTLEALKNLRIKGSATQPHFVSPEWVNQSIRLGVAQNERQYIANWRD